ncbi:MAG TPA: trigger factor [Candidatus Acidoferrum sp.]|nr:trigger factor [Candidatus Acidoferrum sp.]
MKVEVKQGGGLTRHLSVEVPAERVITETEKKFQEVQREATLKGFRKGKAPMNMIKSVYSAEVRADVADEIIKETLRDALSQNALKVASTPTLTDIKFTDDGGLAYTAMIEVFPELGQIRYEGLKVFSSEIVVDDKEVDDVVEYFRKRHSDLRPVEREAKAGDVVTVDLKKLSDPKLVLKVDEFPNSEVDLGNPVTVKEFREAIPGMKVGDEKEVEVIYGDDYSDARMAGAHIKYHCTVKAVKERILPEIDDAFAKQTGMAETALELKLKIRDNLRLQKADSQRKIQAREIVHQMCEFNPVLIPEGMIKEYLDWVVEDFKKTYTGVNEEEIRKDYRQTGIDSMRWDLVFHKLAEQEKLEVSASDTENWISGFAVRNNMTPEQATEALSKSGKASNLRESLLEEKVLDFLMSKAEKTTTAPPKKE